MRPLALRRVAALALAAAALGAGPVTTARADRLAADAYVDAHWPRGASGTVLVARGGRLVTCRGLGWADRERRIRARCDSAYDIMSMTKQFTAAAILKLQSMGRLRVGDRIGRYVAGVPRDKRAITIDQLLTHTAGLRDSLGPDDEPLTRRGLLRRALRTPLLTRPGARFHYSNVGYGVLAAIVERASGRSYERFLRDRLLLPAGMRETGYVLPRWRPGQVVVEYDDRGRPHGHPPEHRWGPRGPWWNLRGNGGLLSTARDMLRWHRALLGNRVLDASARRALFTPRVAEGGGYSYAYGWDVLHARGGRVATHNGGNGWSFGAVGRQLDRGTFAFWVGNHAYQAGRWNLERLDPSFTLGLLRRAR